MKPDSKLSAAQEEFLAAMDNLNDSASVSSVSSVYADVPDDLKKVDAWVLWKWEKDAKGKRTKPPYNAHTQKKAEADDSSTWTSFNHAMSVFIANQTEFNGIGFEIRGIQALIGVDFDSALQNGVIGAYEQSILKVLGNPYCESSPSGKGAHAFAYSEVGLPKGRRKTTKEHFGIEIYSGQEKAPYFTVTGKKISGSGIPTVGPAEIELAYYLTRQNLNLSFRQLWTGESLSKFPSQSEADWALICELIRTYSRDPDKIEKAFRYSGLVRERWTNRPDGYQPTIKNALEEVKVSRLLIEPSYTKATTETKPEKLPQFILGSDIEPKAIRWLWEGFIPLGKITLFAGNPDNGKSMSAESIVAICTNGSSFPNDSPNALPPSEVMMLVGEDDLDDTTLPRLITAGADVRKVHLENTETDDADTPQLRLDRHMKLIEDTLEAYPDIKLLVIDPISNFLGEVNMVVEQETRREVLIPLKRLAKRRGIAVVMIMHLNKKSDLEAISRVGGAMAFIGVSRCCWLFQRDPAGENGTLKNSFSMTRIKNNLVSATNGGLSFHVETRPVRLKDGKTIFVPMVIWDGVNQKSADEVLNTSSEKQNGRPATQLVGAVQWLNDYLRNGAKTLDEIHYAGKSLHGFSEKTLQRARKDANVRTFISGKTTTRKDGKLRDEYSCELPPEPAQGALL